MPQRDVIAYLEDIRSALSEIEMGVAGLSFDTYNAIRQIRSAVEREFMTAGEALRQLLELRPEFEERITAAHEIIAFRNRLAHGYFNISNATVWGVIQGKVPLLQQEVAALMKEEF